MDWIKIERPLFTLFIGAVFLVAMWVSFEWPLRASIIILVLGGIGLALLCAQMTTDIKNNIAGKSSETLSFKI